MRLKAIVCQVFTHEILQSVSQASHEVDIETLPMGLHELGGGMRAQLQARIDAADDQGYDAIVLGFSLCGGGTKGLRAGRTPLVMPRAHDCIGVLMGGHDKAMAFFETHPGVYYRSPGWVDFREPGSAMRPPTQTQPNQPTQCDSSRGTSREGGMVYINTGLPDEERYRAAACAEAESEQMSFESCNGSMEMLELLVSGTWNPDKFLIIPPGAQVRAVAGAAIIDHVYSDSFPKN